MKEQNRFWWMAGGAVLLAAALVVVLSKGPSSSGKSGEAAQAETAAPTAGQAGSSPRGENPGGDRSTPAKSKQSRTPNRPVPSFASIPQPSSTQCLEALAANPRQADRVRAARLLGQRAGDEGLAEEAVEALLDAMNNDEKPQVWLVAARSLGNYGPAAAEAVPSLMKWIDHHTMGDIVIEALGKIGPDAEAALESISQIATDPQARFSLRSKAIEALVGIGGPEHPTVAPVLQAAAKDSDRRIATVAREAVKVQQGDGGQGAEVALEE